MWGPRVQPFTKAFESMVEQILSSHLQLLFSFQPSPNWLQHTLLHPCCLVNIITHLHWETNGCFSVSVLPGPSLATFTDHHWPLHLFQKPFSSWAQCNHSPQVCFSVESTARVPDSLVQPFIFVCHRAQCWVISFHHRWTQLFWGSSRIKFTWLAQNSLLSSTIISNSMWALD